MDPNWNCPESDPCSAERPHPTCVWGPPAPGSRSDFVAGHEPEAVYERARFAGLDHAWSMAVADIQGA